MPPSLLLESKDRDRYGLILGRFKQSPTESVEGSPTKYLVIWSPNEEPSIEMMSRQYVAGSISHAVAAGSSDVSKWAAQNSRRTFMEILAEESLIATDGKSTSTMVSNSKVKSRWKLVINKNRPAEDYDEIIKWLSIEKLIQTSSGIARLKLVAEPAGFFDSEVGARWWEKTAADKILGSFSNVPKLLTPSFYDWHNNLSKFNSKTQDFKEFIEFCKQTEGVLAEQSIELNGQSPSSRAFEEYLGSLDGAIKESAEAALALVWGDLKGLNIEMVEAAELLETTSSTELRDFRTLGNLLKHVIANPLASKVTPEQVVLIAALACDSNLAVNFRKNLEEAAATVPIDVWFALARTKQHKVMAIVNFLGFSSDFGRKLLTNLFSDVEYLFASEIYWASLKNSLLNAEVIGSLSKPLLSTMVKPFVSQALSDCLRESSFSAIALALEDPILSKLFDNSTWAIWISTAMKNGTSERGAQIFELINNSAELDHLKSEVEKHADQFSSLKHQNSILSQALTNAQSEVSNLNFQIEQMRLGMKSSVDSRSDQQIRALTRMIAKLLVTAGSLPDKVDSSVYLQMTQYVKSIGITPIGQEGQIVEFDRSVHVAPPNTEVNSGDRVRIIAPGFGDKTTGEVEVIWKAQVVLG